MSDINIRLAGQAGQGLQTTGNLLVQAFSRLGLHVLASQSYMSRIRGGLNWYDIKVSSKEVHSMFQTPDILVALTKEALEKLSDNVSENSIILFDGQSNNNDVIDLEFTKTAKDISGTPLMANTVAAGAILTVLGYDISDLQKYLEDIYASKSEEIANKNVKCLNEGAAMAKKYQNKLEAPEGSQAKDKAIYNGAHAVALSAARSGVKFVAAYPMTPGTSTFINLIKLSKKYNLVSEQAEDEIAAINMICGAAAAGVPSMTTTSGGGFALMCEGVSLAGMMELPILVLISQRPGPATGLPTRTAQQDLNLVVYAGHGEFPKIVYAPGTIEQCYEIPRIALETAHKYQSPAFILTDQYLVDLKKNMAPLNEEYDPIDRCIVEPEDEDYQRFELTEDGISPRAIYGGKGWVIYDSDEHTEDGHLTEDLDIAVQMYDKRMTKNQGILNDFVMPEWYGPDAPENLLVCWGSTYGAMREAVDTLNNENKKTAMLHFSQVWPINIGKIQDLISSHSGSNIKPIFVEENGTGQFAALCRQIGLFDNYSTCLKYNGLPFTGEEIADRIKQENIQ